jgi:hypothetical protein
LAYTGKGERQRAIVDLKSALQRNPEASWRQVIDAELKKLEAGSNLPGVAGDFGRAVRRRVAVCDHGGRAQL